MNALPLLAFALVIVGCTGPVNAPSLLPRAIEKQGDTPPPSPSPVAIAPIDRTLGSRIAALLAQAKAGDADFTKADSEGAPAITAGRGASEGSERWILAEQARSAMGAARQTSAAALAELDSLLIAQTEAAARDTTVGGLVELAAAQDAAEAIVARQSARLEALNR